MPTLGQQIRRWLGILLLLCLTIFVVLGLYAVWTAWKLWTNCSVSEPFSVSENAPSASAPPSFWNPQQGTGNNAGGQEIHGSLFPNQPEQPTP
ncbi:MAG: hypothetical protein J5556_02875, partial [Deltaproteobacteria bacterium]|nr:hypothetical protein [Deltaproteobacteria bacterium]